MIIQPLSSTRVAYWAGALGATLTSFAALYVWRNFTVDDAFIAWRHGFNLVQSGSYSFNADGPRVEAATSPVYGLMAAIPALIGIDVVLFFKLVAVVVIAAAAALAFRARSRAGGVLYVFLALAGPVQAVHFWSGLETGAYLVLCTWVGAIALGIAQARARTFVVLLVVMVLVRAEGIFFAAAASLVMVQAIRGNQLRRLKACVLLLAWPTVALLFLTGLRWAYFGTPLPNTFLAKSSLDSFGLDSILLSATQNLSTFAPFFLAALLIILLNRENDRRRLALLLAGAVATAIVVYLPSGLTMNYAGRFPFQVFWPIVLVSALALRRVNLGSVFVVAVVWLLPLANGVSLEVRSLVGYYPRLLYAHGGFGDALKGELTDGKRILVTGDAGILPFNSEWPTADFNFLGTSASVGFAGIIQEVERHPAGVLALYATGPGASDALPFQAELITRAEGQGYRLLSAFMFRPDYWMQVWLGPLALQDQDLVARLTSLAEVSVAENDRIRTRAEDIIPWYWTASASDGAKR